MTFHNAKKMAKDYGYNFCFDEANRIHYFDYFDLGGNDWQIDLLEKVIYNTETGEKFDLG